MAEDDITHNLCKIKIAFSAQKKQTERKRRKNGSQYVETIDVVTITHVLGEK